jgi:hypothetical protein
VATGATSDFIATQIGEQHVTIDCKSDMAQLISGTVTFREQTDTKIVLDVRTDPATWHLVPDLRFEVTNR